LTVNDWKSIGFPIESGPGLRRGRGGV